MRSDRVLVGVGVILLQVLLLLPIDVIFGIRLTLTAESRSAGQQRRWVEIPRTRPGQSRPGARLEAGAAGRTIRVLSYNVLGARQGLSEKHGHVGIDIRNWTTRRDRLREEIWSYNKSERGGLHVVCLQEVTFRTLGDTWLPFMARLGLDRHVYQPKSDRPQRRHRSRCLGVAIFYSSKIFEKSDELRVVFSEEARGLRKGGFDRTRRPPESDLESPRTRGKKQREAQGDQFLRRVYGGDTGTGGPGGRPDPATASRLEQDLEDKHDAAAMVRLRLKPHGDSETGGVSGDKGQAITVVCAHLFYDPRRPDLKTAQCQILFQAIQRFNDKCGVGKERPANLILCADFNSKPTADPNFLPGPLKAVAEKLLSAVNITREPASDPLHPRISEDIYPRSDTAVASGVYSLLDYGRVSSTHPEHPDSFIPQFVKATEEGEAIRRNKVENDERRRWSRSRRGGPLLVRAAHRASGDWVSGFGVTLEDVYRDRGKLSPRFTTKTSSFSGVIDHLFVSTGEEHSGLEIVGALAFPQGAHLGGETEATSTTVSLEGDGSGGPAHSPSDQSYMQHVGEVKHGQLLIHCPTAPEFPPIPNKIWGSDHLALGVEVALV